VPKPPPRSLPPARQPLAGRLFSHPDTSLLDVVDNLLNKGVVLQGDVVLALADVDLVYLRLSVLLCAADRALGGGHEGRRGRKRRKQG
jgi:hypothetical protein